MNRHIPTTSRRLRLFAALFAATAAGTVWAQRAPLGQPPNVVHPREVPADPRAAEERERRKAGEDPTQVRILRERESYGQGRDAVRVPATDEREQQRREREARLAAPEPESPNRRADQPSRDRVPSADPAERRRAVEDLRRRAP